MGEQSGIEWTTATWNPVIGCAKVSPACTNCYAEEYAAKRLKRPELWRGARHVTSQSVWNLPGRVDRKAAREGRRARLSRRLCPFQGPVERIGPRVPGGRNA